MSTEDVQNPPQPVVTEPEKKQEKPGMAKELVGFLKKAGDQFSKIFLNQAVLTVILTAIAGPIVVNSINSNIKNKELQKQVIEKMLEYTSNTDFSKPESLEKISIIAKMVDENKDIFGLSFAQTDSVIQNLYGEISKVGLANLNKKRKEYESKIADINVKLASDTTNIMLLEKQKAQVSQDLASRNNDENLKKQLANIDLQLKELYNRRDMYLNQISYWNNQLALLDKDIETARQDLTLVIEQKRVNEEKYQKILVENKKNSISADSLARSLRSAFDDIMRLNKTLADADSLQRYLQNDINTLKKQLADKEALIGEQNALIQEQNATIEKLRKRVK